MYRESSATGGRRAFHRLGAVAVLSSAVVLSGLAHSSTAFAGQEPPLPPEIPTQGWLPPAMPTVPSSPNRVGAEFESRLTSTSAISRGDVWAVGDSSNDDTTKTLIEHKNGKTWKVVPSPNPAGGNFATLNAVDALSPDNVWAVGYSQEESTISTLIEHWDGRAWTIVPSPNADGAAATTLYGVSAVTANDVWAVGYSAPGAGPITFHTIVMHWDGTAWTIVPSPDPSGTTYVFLLGLTALSASDVWAVGYYSDDDGATWNTLIEHWDGTEWTIVPSPNRRSASSSFLLGVSASSTNDVWAVGHSSDGSTTNSLTQHWDGTSWSIVPSPDPAGSTIGRLLSVEAVSANDVWAVGNSYDGSTLVTTLTEHWNGRKWRIVPSPNPAGVAANLNSVDALPNGKMWAVGHSSTGFPDLNTLVEKWNGLRWKLVASPNP